jgi:signal transduction histidine kinase/FixJ family two-component response regulator
MENNMAVGLELNLDYTYGSEEELRLKALLEYEVLDSEAEQDFDDLTRLAASLCNTPISLITFVDQDRQWFKSALGIDIRETLRSISFCTHAIEGDDVFELKDMLQEPVFATNPLVTEEPHLRFYAGMPLITPNGYRLGTICVMDVVPRELTLAQKEALRVLGRQVVNNLELRKQNLQLDREKRKLEYYNLQFQHTSEVIWVVNADTLVVEEVNQTIEQVLGFAVNQVVQKSFWSLFHNYDGSRDNMYLYAMPGETDARTSFIARFENVYQEEIWLSSSAVLLHGKWFIVSRNVTEQRKAKAALEKVQEQVEQQKDFYENILSHLPSDVAVFSSQHRYLYLNPSACAKQECREWIIGKTDREYCQHWQKDIQLAELREEMFAKAIASQQVVSWEEKLTDPAGEVLHKVRNYVPVFDATGTLSFMIGYGMDISQQKQAQETLVEAKALVEHSMKAKEFFFSSLSHELRTPMNAVIGLAYLLEKENKQDSQKENLSTLKHSAESLLRLINDILDFSKIEAGKVVFEESPIELHRLVNSIQQALVFKAHEKSIALTTSFESDVPANVLGDSVSLTQVLNNLVSNAIKFTNYGSVHLNVGLIEINETHARLKFSVTDTGIGIAPSKIGTIFESFTQANASTTRKYGGTGLGLAITKKLLELQGGTIQVCSRKGVGSTFSFELTYKIGKAAKPVVTATVKTQANLQGVHVLIVEDNAINRLIAGKFLTHWQASFDFAEDGRQAIEMYAKHEYDIVLMDLEMPVVDGYEATQAIMQSGKFAKAQTPIMALTASALSEVRERVLAMGVVDFVTKPFDPEQLLNKMVHYTKHSRSKQVPVFTDDEVAPFMSLANIQALAEGSTEFLLEMLDMYIHYFKQLSEEYPGFFKNNNVAGLQALQQSLVPALHMLEAVALQEHLQEGINLLKENTASEESIALHCRECTDMLFSMLCLLGEERSRL